MNRAAVVVVAVAALLCASAAAATAPPASAPRLAVIPLGAGDAARASLERAAAARHDVTAVDRATVDAVLAGLKSAGLSCRDDDVPCLVKLGIEGDFDLVLAASARELHIVDVATGKDRGRVAFDPADAAASLARALAPPPPRAAPPAAPPAAAATTTTTADAPRAATPATATTVAAAPPAVGEPRSNLGLLVGIGGGVVSAGLAIGAVAIDATLIGQLNDANRAQGGKPLDTGSFHTLETVEVALAAAAVVVGVGAVAVAVVE